MGQAHVRRCIDDLMPIVSDGSDPLGVTSFATHQLPLEQAPDGYDMFRNKADGLHQGGSAALAGGVAWQGRWPSSPPVPAWRNDGS
jgi:hypothetical protein